MKRYIHSLLMMCSVIIATSVMSQSLQVLDKFGNYLSNDTNIDISNPYPNPAINYTSFKYSFPENTLHAQFVLRDILGSPVKEIDIGSREGKLLVNTSDIKSGIYFYSFYVDNKLILTKKLIVR